MRKEVLLPNFNNFLLLYFLIVLTFLFGLGILSNTFIIVTALFSLLGGYISYSNDNKYIENNRFVNICIVATIAWIAFMVLFRSDFILKKAMASIIKGVYIIIAALSFNSKNSYTRIRIQGLSTVLVAIYPLVININILYGVLFLLYILAWLLTFYYSYRKEEYIPYRSLMTNLIVYSAIVAFFMPFVYFLSKQVYSPEAKPMASVFKEEIIGYEDRLNELEDKMYKDFITFADNNRHAKKDVVRALSVVLSKSQSSLMLDNEIYILKEIVKKKGTYTSEKGKRKLIKLAEDYLEAKTMANLLYGGDSLYALMGKGEVNLYKKIKVKMGINRIYASSSIGDIKKYFDSLNRLIEISGGVKKDDLKKSLDNFREWKMQSVYYGKKKEIVRYVKRVSEEENANTKTKQLSEEAQEILNKVERGFTVKDILDTYNTFDKFINKKRDIFVDRHLKKELKSILDVKLELILRDSLKSLRSDFSRKLAPVSVDKVIHETKQIVYSDKVNSIVDGIYSLANFLQEYRLDSTSFKSDRLAELIKGKLFLLCMDNGSAIREILESRVVPLSKINEVTGLIDDMLLKDNSGVESLYYKLKDDIDRFYFAGQLYEKDKYKILQRLERIYRIAKAKCTLNSILYKKGGKNRYNPWENFLFSLRDKSLNEELNKIMNKLRRGGNIKEIEALKHKLLEAVEEVDIDKYTKDKAKEYINTVYMLRKKYFISETFIRLMESVSIVKDLDKRKRKDLIRTMSKIQESYIEEGVLDESLVEGLKGVIAKVNIDKDKLANEKYKQRWEVFVLPSKLVIDMSSTRNIRVFSMRNKRVVEDVTRQVNWKLSNDNIVWVDKEGCVHPLRPGKTDIFVEYNQEDVAVVEVIVIANYEGVIQ